MLHSATSHYTSLVVRYARLTNALAVLGQRLSMASSAMLVTGALPSADLIESLRSTRELFDQVRAEIFDLARTAGVTPHKAVDEVVSLRDLTEVLEGLEAAHAHSCALSVLDRVGLLRHLDCGEFGALAEAQGRAQVLKAAIVATGLVERHAEVAPLADGRHPFAQLLELVETGQSLDDERWRHLETTVTNEFGRVLAAAAARGKLQLGGAGGGLAPLDADSEHRVVVPVGELKVQAEDVPELVVEHAWTTGTAEHVHTNGIAAGPGSQSALIENAPEPPADASPGATDDGQADLVSGDADAQVTAGDTGGVVERQVHADEADATEAPAVEGHLGPPHAEGRASEALAAEGLAWQPLVDEPLTTQPSASGGGRRLARRARSLADAVVRLVLVLVVVGAAAVLTPLLFGWQFYAVDGSSMEPAITLGSGVAVQPVSLSQVRVGDIITFPDRTQPDIRVTHRVVALDAQGGRTVVRTKGDANDLDDAVPVEGDQFVGRVAFYLPYAGALTDYLSGPYTVFLFAGVVSILLLSQVIGRGKRLEV